LSIISLLENMLGDKTVNTSILDFGCGKGDLVAYLKQYNIGAESFYIGIDAMEENIEDAQKFNKEDFRLLNWTGENNLLQENETVDLILFSGSFATTEPHIRNKLFSKLLTIANIGVIGTFLTYNKIVPSYESGCVLTYPEEIFKLIDNSVFATQFKADYLPHDFTIGVIKWSAL